MALEYILLPCIVANRKLILLEICDSSYQPITDVMWQRGDVTLDLKQNKCKNYSRYHFRVAFQDVINIDHETLPVTAGLSYESLQ